MASSTPNSAAVGPPAAPSPAPSTVTITGSVAPTGAPATETSAAPPINPAPPSQNSFTAAHPLASSLISSAISMATSTSSRPVPPSISLPKPDFAVPSTTGASNISGAPPPPPGAPPGTTTSAVSGKPTIASVANTITDTFISPASRLAKLQTYLPTGTWITFTALQTWAFSISPDIAPPTSDDPSTQSNCNTHQRIALAIVLAVGLLVSFFSAFIKTFITDPNTGRIVYPRPQRVSVPRQIKDTVTGVKFPYRTAGGRYIWPVSANDGHGSWVRRGNAVKVIVFKKGIDVLVKDSWWKSAPALLSGPEIELVPNLSPNAAPDPQTPVAPSGLPTSGGTPTPTKEKFNPLHNLISGLPSIASHAPSYLTAAPPSDSLDHSNSSEVPAPKVSSPYPDRSKEYALTIDSFFDMLVPLPAPRWKLTIRGKASGERYLDFSSQVWVHALVSGGAFGVLSLFSTQVSKCLYPTIPSYLPGILQTVLLTGVSFLAAYVVTDNAVSLGQSTPPMARDDADDGSEIPADVQCVADGVLWARRKADSTKEKGIKGAVAGLSDALHSVSAISLHSHNSSTITPTPVPAKASAAPAHAASAPPMSEKSEKLGK